MKFDPVEKKLKNGQTVVIRQCMPEDAKRLLRAIGDYLGEYPHFLTTPAEFDMTVEKEEAWIRSFIEHNNSLLLVAEHNGKIIGNLDVTGGRKTKILHTALVGIGMYRAWKGCGLGTALFECMLGWARRNDVTLLWLQVFGKNTDAIALYHKMGFTESGRQHHFFRADDQSFDDNVTMTLHLK